MNPDPFMRLALFPLVVIHCAHALNSDWMGDFEVESLGSIVDGLIFGEAQMEDLFFPVDCKRGTERWPCQFSAWSTS